MENDKKKYLYMYLPYGLQAMINGRIVTVDPYANSSDGDHIPLFYLFDKSLDVKPLLVPYIPEGNISINVIDFYLKNHIDIFGLINDGIAIKKGGL